MDKATSPKQAFKSVWVLAGGTLLVFGIGVLVTNSQAGVVKECANLAHMIANAKHTVLNSEAAQRTEQQVYRECIADPDAFRRLVR